MRFKVGDKVRIKDECVGNNYYDGLWFNKEMEKFKDKELTIQKISGNHYWIAEATYTYNDEMLEPFEFKVGDEVVIIDARCKRSYLSIGIIERIEYKKDYQYMLNTISVRIKKVNVDDEYLTIDVNSIEELLHSIQLLKDFNEQQPNLEEIEDKVKQKFKPSDVVDEFNIHLGEGKITIDTSKLELPDIKEGENEMDILEIYEQRKLAEINDKYFEEKNKIILQDKVHKIIEETENQLNVILDRDEENAVELDFEEYEPSTNLKLEELKINKSKEEFDLSELIEEIKAQLEISDSYVTTIEIYKNYGILDKEGKIYNGKKSKK